MHRDPHRGLRIGLLLRDDRFVDPFDKLRTNVVIRQLPANARHAVAHVLRAEVDGPRAIELDGDVADLPFGHELRAEWLLALAGHRLDALDEIGALPFDKLRP